MTPTLRFAACQFPVSGNVAANLRYILRLMHRASDAGAAIAHFPEAALPGYARLDFPSFADFELNNKWRDAYNPLRGISMPRLVSLLEAGERGQYADLQWFYHYMERPNAMVFSVMQRRRAALLSCDWDVKQVSGDRAQEETERISRRGKRGGCTTRCAGDAEARRRGYGGGKVEGTRGVGETT